jgi:hypothetical protein
VGAAAPSGGVAEREGRVQVVGRRAVGVLGERLAPGRLQVAGRARRGAAGAGEVVGERVGVGVGARAVARLQGRRHAGVERAGARAA